MNWRWIGSGKVIQGSSGLLLRVFHMDYVWRGEFRVVLGRCSLSYSWMPVGSSTAYFLLLVTCGLSLSAFSYKLLSVLTLCCRISASTGLVRTLHGDFLLPNGLQSGAMSGANEFKQNNLYSITKTTINSEHSTP